MRLLVVLSVALIGLANPFSETERGEEEGGATATSIVDLCVHRPKSDLLRSVRGKSEGKGV